MRALVRAELRWSGAAALALLLTLTACSEEPASDKGTTDQAEDGLKDKPPRDAGRDARSAQPADAARPAVDAALDAKTVVTKSGQLPASVCKIMRNNGCLDCHKTPLANNAPMKLETAQDFQAEGIAALVMARVQDKQRPMPPINSTRGRMPDDQITALQGWIDDGMQGDEGAEKCSGSEAADGGGLVEPIPDWAKRGWPEGACEQVITLGAHGAGRPLAQDNSGFPISTAKTDYHCFYEQVPQWPAGKTMHAIGLRVRKDTPDDEEFVHHLVVSGQEITDNSLAGNKPNFNGDHKHCDNPTGSTLAVWAPGSQNPITTPDDVGVLLPSSGSYFELQVHYNNPKGKPGHVSRVQYDICVSSKKLENTAGTFWLGYENAGVQTITGLEGAIDLDNKGNGRATGVCTAKTRGRILSIMPHMHELGKHAQVQVWRKDGTKIPLVDSAFAFEEQYSFFKGEFWVEPGDQVVTSCEWSKSPVSFGFASDQEMCFFYTLAYPLDTFKPGLGERGLVGGNLACAAMAGPTF